MDKVILLLLAILLLAPFCSAIAINKDTSFKNRILHGKSPFKEEKKQLNQEEISTTNPINYLNVFNSSPLLLALVSNITLESVVSDPLIRRILELPIIRSIVSNYYVQNFFKNPLASTIGVQSILDAIFRADSSSEELGVKNPAAISIPIVEITERPTAGRIPIYSYILDIMNDFVELLQNIEVKRQIKRLD